MTALGWLPRFVRHKDRKPGVIRAWLEEKHTLLTVKCVDAWQPSQGFREGVFRRHYCPDMSVWPFAAEIALSEADLHPLLVPVEPVEPLTHEEYFLDLDATRSNGPPTYVTKAQAFDADPRYAPDLWISLVLGNSPPQVIVGVQDKDEILDKKKLERTRNFTPLPGEWHYVEKRLFERLLDDMLSKERSSPIRVGNHMFGGDMHHMMRKHAGRVTYEFDFASLEYTFKPWVWDWLTRCRAASSTLPWVVRATYAAVRRAWLHHPNGNLYGPSDSNKSGRLLTLLDNCIAALLVLHVAWQRACARLGWKFDFWRDVGRYLDVYGDNIWLSLSGELERRGAALILQEECWRLGFGLKVNGKSTGGFGLVWNGFTIREPGGYMEFANPEKLLARAYYYGTSPQLVADQSVAFHMTCYFTPFREVFAQMHAEALRQGAMGRLLPERQICGLLGSHVPEASVLKDLGTVAEEDYLPQDCLNLVSFFQAQASVESVSPQRSAVCRTHGCSIKSLGFSRSTSVTTPQSTGLSLRSEALLLTISFGVKSAESGTTTPVAFTRAEDLRSQAKMPHKTPFKSKKKKVGKKKKQKGPAKAKGGGMMVVSAAGPASRNEGLTEFRRIERRFQSSTKGGVTRYHVIDLVKVGSLVGTSTAPRNLAGSIGLSFSPGDFNFVTLSQTFPVLRGFVQMFKRYKIVSCRVGWQGICPTTQPGQFAAAVLPGAVDTAAASDSPVELAMNEHSVLLPVYKTGFSRPWTNRENRWFIVDDNIAGSQQPIPATLVYCIGGNTSSSAVDVGNVWVDIVVDVCDMVPAPSTYIQLSKSSLTDVSQTLTNGAADSTLALSWNRQVSGQGWWNWLKEGANKWVSNTSGTGLSFPPSTLLDMDSGQYLIATSLQLSAEADALEERKGTALLEWVRAEADAGEDFKKVELARFPQAPRRVETRVVCAFKNWEEAREAHAKGFDPQRVITALPNALGDWVLGLFCQPLFIDVAASLLTAVVFSPGTGAVAQDYTFFVNALTGPCRYWTTAYPNTAGKKRQFQGGNLSVVNCNGVVNNPH